MIIASEIQRMRAARGWSQARLAEAVGVSQPTIAALESGEQRSSKFLPRIAAALGVAIVTLDPEYRDRASGNEPISPGAALDPERLTSAFEEVLLALGLGLSRGAAKGLAEGAIFLALTPPDRSIALSYQEQTRLRAQFLASQFAPK
jgi:transcriptional regulator with XRE-family HTH domain